ncbi:LacI family DNA-binding transcriptional regulator [Roseomonas sp. SSH11]|uniref:LacI family DNA-binding transcriptional regulator n=1 Tax=Pararoseomonas baculiformis TaxID=2820812 RepID=A0ABS4AAP8_9PROT|nr:LacI family DNA-binding transcriptional regulator [Pararoseomonas baculiformis]MBP0444076.1 LacI family DNA-binding transcriptional regulator [Pararoseomonas baculiformis]
MRPPSPNRLTLNDVAARAGVSRATVSLVLRDSPLVAAETRERVQAAVDALGYVYNRGAATLRARRTQTIGLLVTDLSNPFFAEMAIGVERVMEAEGYVSFLVSTGESLDRQERFLRRMREQGVDGVVLCPATGTTPEVIARLREWRLPCVQALRFVSPRPGGEEGDYAGADYQFGIEQAVEHLIRLGHRRIAFIGGQLLHSATRERWTGFSRAMRRNGLDDGLVLRTPLTRLAGAEAVGALLDTPDPPSAAVCFNDIVAFGVMLGLERRGLRAGRDMAVTGVDDLPDAALTEPPLTTVATLPRLVGEESARLLLRRIAEPDRARERIILPARLVVRATCGGPRAQAPARPIQAALP